MKAVIGFLVGIGMAASGLAAAAVAEDIDRARQSADTNVPVLRRIIGPKPLIIGCERPCGCRYIRLRAPHGAAARPIRRHIMASNTRFMNPSTIAKPGGYSHVVEITGPARIVYIAGQKTIRSGVPIPDVSRR